MRADGARRWPSPWLIGAVALAHVALLASAAQRASPRVTVAYAPAMLTRTIAAPAPLAAEAPRPVQRPMRHAPPRAAAKHAPAHARARPIKAHAPPPAADTPEPESAPPPEVLAAAPDAILPDSVVAEADGMASTSDAPVATDEPATGPQPPAEPAASAATAEPPASATAAEPVALAAATAQAAPSAAAPTGPVSVPDSITLRYHVTGSARGLTYQADAQLQWRLQDGRYQAVWSINLPFLGTRTQRSEGRVGAAGLEPERYAENMRDERVARFDAGARRIHFSGDKPDAALETGAQDRLSVTLQFSSLLAAAPERYPPGTQITMQTAGVRGAESWTWEVLADQTLPLLGTDVPCVRLLRRPRKEHEHDARIELWLARSLNYLPVRLRLTQPNGDVADQQLQNLDQTPANPQ
jgi:hypothetical protein